MWQGKVEIVKYWLMIVMLMLGARAQAMPMLSLIPSGTTFGFNEAFTVDVFVSSVEATDPLLAFGFDVESEHGLAFNSATVAFSFLDDSDFFATTDVAGSMFPSISGDNILLSTLSLTTGATEGFLELSIFTTPADFGFSEGLFTLMSTFDIDQTVTVEVVRGATVALPSTMLLMFLGLLGVQLRSRRCKRNMLGPVSRRVRS